MYRRVRHALGNGYRRLPEGVRFAILVKRREPLWLEKGIVFIHVPKAAGTSINQALFGQFMGHMGAADVERWGSKRLRALPRFAVVRNPWDRLLSAYHFVKRGRGIGDAVTKVRNPEQYRRPEFDSFERFVREWLSVRDVDTLDFVFRQQWRFVCDRHRNVLVDHIGRVEDLAPTHAFLDEKLDRSVQFERHNRSGLEAGYRSHYTPALAALVGEIYRDDLDLFGYRF